MKLLRAGRALPVSALNADTELVRAPLFEALCLAVRAARMSNRIDGIQVPIHYASKLVEE